MTRQEIIELLRLVKFQNYTWIVGSEQDLFIQASYREADVYTGKIETQHTRKWRLSPHMTKSEIVQTAFKLCITSMEHRTREEFTYRGERVFGPHFDVDELFEIARQRKLDVRE